MRAVQAFHFKGGQGAKPLADGEDPESSGSIVFEAAKAKGLI